MTKISHIIRFFLLAVLVVGGVYGLIYMYVEKILHCRFFHVLNTSNKYKALFYLSLIYISGLILYLINRRKKIRFKKQNPIDIFAYIILPLIAIIIVGVCFAEASNEMTYMYNKVDYYKFVLLSMIISFGIIIPVDQVIKISKQKTKTLIMQKEQEMYKKQINDARKYIEEIAAIKHDMKNQILCISALLEDGNITEVRKLCKSMESELNDTSYVFNTDNLYLNSILNVLYKKAKENGIDVKAVIKSSFIKINGSDLISLLGNLGDNAIEALQAVNQDKRTLQIVMTEKGGYYLLIFTNYIETSVLENNRELSSSKPDKLYHGYGMKTIRSISEKYNGIIDISEEDHIFKIGIMLKIPSITK